jgi:CHAT domain-containing protein
LAERLTAKALRNDAVIKLLAGEVDLAIDELSKATELAPSNAAVWSDLAAARLQRSTVASDPYELVLALAAANRAVHHDPKLLAGRFNRALALARLALRGPAVAEWQLISRRERNPSWAREARERATEVAQEAVSRDWQRDLAMVKEAVEQGKPERIRTIVAGSPQSFREHLEVSLLALWAAAEKDHRESDAIRELAVARAIANALVAIGGDRMSADTIEQIERTRASDPRRFRQLVAGFLVYSEGLALADDRLFLRALPRFQKAREVLAREGSPFAHWAAYQVAHCQYQETKYKPARARLLELTRNPASAPYKALQGRSFSLMGLIDGIEGRHTDSITSFKAAEAAFRRAREAPSAAKARALLATELDVLGQRQEAWRQLYPALSDPATFDKPDIRFSIYEYASWLTWREDQPEIALLFQDETVKNARATGKANVIITAHRERANLFRMLGKKTEAARDLAQARRALQNISDPSLYQVIEGDLLLAEAEVSGTTSPRQAIDQLDKAIQIFRDTSYHYRLGYALQQRALAEKALGQNDAAERDLIAAIAELEEQRKAIDSAEDRTSYFDRVKEIFDTMIAFQLEQRQRAGEALRFSEQAKARVLWDWIMAGPSGEAGPSHLRAAAAQPVDLESIRRSLPAGTAVIEYAVLPKQTVLWVLHRDGELRSETVETTAESLDDLVQRFRRALLQGRSAELENLSKQVYDLLIQPVAHHLAPGERLVLIPDGALHTLPFSLLRNRQTGRYLIQERAFVVAPSVPVYAASRRRDRALAGRPGRVLVVAAPEFDRDIDPTLLDLSAGDTEASIARIFPGSQVLRGPGATREAFLRAAGDFESLYFGGHSIVNADFPLLSQMLFAKAPADPTRGVLYSGDLLRQRFPRTRLVVLASCSTALGRTSRTEGVENLARPFLVAGVPSVVASLWNVGDEVTADFFVRFYRRLQQRFDVAWALRETQVESIERGSGPAANPRVWGAFEVIGGGVGDSGGADASPISYRSR